MPDTTPSLTPADDALTPAQRAWVDAYFAGGMNQTAASRLTHPTDSAPHRHGSRMVRNGKVEAAIRERLATLRIDANAVLYRIQERATATAEDFLRFDTEVHRPVVLRPLSERLAELRAEMAFEDEYATRAGFDEAEIEAHEARMAEWRREELRLVMRLEIEPGAVESHMGPPVERVVEHFDLAAMRAAGKLHLVKSVNRTRDGIKVELHDAAHADDVLAKHTGLVGPTGTKEDPLHHAVAPIELRIVNAPRAGAAAPSLPAPDRAPEHGGR